MKNTASRLISKDISQRYKVRQKDIAYIKLVKLIRAKGECLGIKNRRRTQKAAKSHE